jgi:thioredoxin reductase
MFCKGFEQAGAPSVGVLVTPGPFGPGAGVKLSYQARRFSENVVIYTNGDEAIARATREGLEGDSLVAAGRVTIDERKIRRLVRGSATPSEVVVEFADGTSKAEGFIAHIPGAAPKGPFAEQLGLKLGAFGDIQVTPPFNSTSVHGVFGAGDAATPFRGVVTASFTGLMAAAGIIQEIGEEMAKGPNDHALDFFHDAWKKSQQRSE